MQLVDSEMGQSSQDMSELNQAKWLPWLVCITAALFFFYEFIQGNMFASISEDIMRDFGLNNVQSGYLSSIYYVSNVLFLFPAGMVLDRFSTKKIIVLAMVLCIAGTFLFAAATNFYLALFCRFVTGIGSAFCFLSCIRLASRWFRPDKMALVSGVIVTMAMIGGMVAQYPLTWLLLQVGWREAVVIDGLLGVAFLLVILQFVKDYPAGQEEIELQHKKNLADMGFFTSLKTAYFSGQNVLAAIYTSVMNMPIAVIGAMIGSLYLHQAEGMSRDVASMTVTFLFAGTIIGGPILGAWSDKIARRKLPMLLGVLGSFAIILVILYVPISSQILWYGLFFLLGFFTASQVISYPLVAENSPLSLTASSVSVVSILTMSGYVVYQNIFNHLLSSRWTGIMSDSVRVYTKADYQYALFIIPIGFVIALIAYFFIKETHCQRREDNG